MYQVRLVAALSPPYAFSSAFGGLEQVQFALRRPSREKFTKTFYVLFYTADVSVVACPVKSF